MYTCSFTSSSGKQGMKYAGWLYCEFMLQESNHHGRLLMTNSFLTCLMSVQPQDQVKFTENFMALAFNIKVGSEIWIFLMPLLDWRKHTS